MRFWLLILLAGMGGAQGQSLESAMLAAHNAVRAQVGVPPLTWSNRLAKIAQQWADHLVANRKFSHRPHSVYGENLFAITGGTSSVEQVVDAWAGEARNFDYRRNKCHGDCGHYTQIVWSATREVGCAVAGGKGREVWVCDYDPPGNWVGMRPY